MITHADLEHDNIVRYKTTWQGSPLPDEQEIIEQLKLATFPDGNSDSPIDLGSDSEDQVKDPKGTEKEEKDRQTEKRD